MLEKIDNVCIGAHQSFVDFFHVEPDACVNVSIKLMVVIEVVGLVLAHMNGLPLSVIAIKGVMSFICCVIMIGLIRYQGKFVGSLFRVLTLVLTGLALVGIESSHELASALSMVAMTAAYYFCCCTTPPPRKKTAGKLSFGF